MNEWKAFIVNVSLDESEEELEESRTKLITHTLSEFLKTEHECAYRFRYDLEGSSHWDGSTFVLESASGNCFLRYADYDDTTDMVSRLNKHGLAKVHREDELKWKFNPITNPKTPKGILVELGPVVDLNVETIRCGLDMFQVDVIMDS